MLTKKDIERLYGKVTTNKYGNTKVKTNVGVFDSQKEFTRYCQLIYLERAKEIKNLQRQVRYELIPKTHYGRAIYYVADFVYEEKGKIVVEDVKSEATKTPVYKLKKRLLAEKYNIVITEIT